MIDDYGLENEGVDKEEPLEEEPRCGRLTLIRFLVKTRRYEVGEKVAVFIEEGFFTIEDLEHSICSGQVRKTQKDEMGESLGNKKYVVVGTDTHGYDFYSVGKIVRSTSGKFYYVITAHSAGEDYDEL